MDMISRIDSEEHLRVLSSAVAMTSDHLTSFLEGVWDDSIVPTLQQYIRIPNQSPLFDPDWKSRGHMHAAVALARGWAEKQSVDGLKLEVHELEGRTPLIFMEIPGDASSTVLMYGHLD